MEFDFLQNVWLGSQSNLMDNGSQMSGLQCLYETCLIAISWSFVYSLLDDNHTKEWVPGCMWPWFYKLLQNYYIATIKQDDYS